MQSPPLPRLVYITLVKSLVFQNTFTNVRTCEMEDEEVACEIYMPTALFEIDGHNL